ncbi:Uncharacterised protein [Myroides odoratus]|nr:hypothetical protein Myrod_2463 [Myroides odoratus DSM 2801]EKB06671.1 hypothetical protein HMPREF9716_02326 [Myroides odoratus CIP 103059]STZ30561.1 Uncharacterised protein [Myroides odoratus]
MRVDIGWSSYFNIDKSLQKTPYIYLMFLGLKKPFGIFSLVMIMSLMTLNLEQQLLKEEEKQILMFLKGLN